MLKSGWVVLLLAAAACRSNKSGQPVANTPAGAGSGSGQGFGSGSDGPKDELDACLGVHTTFTHTDPHGQGRLLEGFGFPDRGTPADPKKPVVEFGQLDAFTLSSIKLNGIPLVLTVDDNLQFEFSSEEKQKRIAANKSKPKSLDVDDDGLLPSDWIHIQMTGTLKCVRSTTTHEATVEIVDARYIHAERPSLHGWRFGFKLVSLDNKVQTTAPDPTSRTDGDPNSVANALCEGRADGAFPIRGSVGHDGKYSRDDHPATGSGTPANDGGEPESDQKTFSLACTHRDIGKCVDFGNYSTATPATGAFDFLQACMRMMSADYCGDGKSWTVDDTWVEFWDYKNGSASTSHPTATFEAAWNESGATCWNHARVSGVFDETPKCLTADKKCSQASGSFVFNQSCPDTSPCQGDQTGAPLNKPAGKRSH